MKMREKQSTNTEDNSKTISFIPIHMTQVISGLIFLAIGIVSLIFYDYGLISFLFAIPQFFATGFIPLLIGFLIIVRNLLELESVTFSSRGDDGFKLITKRKCLIGSKELKFDFSDIQYVGLKYRETKSKRWLIVILLVLVAIEIDYQNAMDLIGYARIAPLLVLYTILMFTGIVLFAMFPKRFIEIGTPEKKYLIQYKELKNNELENLLSVLMVDLNQIIIHDSIKQAIRNVKSELVNFILGVFLLCLAILLMVGPLYYGYFTRIVAFAYGLKLMLRSINKGQHYSSSKDGNSHYMGSSLRLTFIKTKNADFSSKIDVNPLRFHLFEIACIFYLLSQAVKYGLRFTWWLAAGINPLYLLIGLIIFFLLFIKWFNPIHAAQLKFPEYSIYFLEDKKHGIQSQLKNMIKVLKLIKVEKKPFISLILFIGFIIGPLLYYIFGGIFVLL